MATNEQQGEENRLLPILGGGQGMSVVSVSTAGAIARAEAEVKAQVFLAKQFPRDEITIFKSVIRSVQRPEMADDATYRFPRGGNTIEGPSVYLAREIARLWGNMRYGLRVVGGDEEWLHIEGWAHDIQTNTFTTAEDRFKRLIQRKNKQTQLTEWVQPDERDLRELVNRRGAILIRNCVLELLPPDLVNEAVRVAAQTRKQAAEGTLKANREDTLRQMVLVFDSMAITVPMLEAYVGHSLRDLSAAEYSDLMGVAKAIKDGQASRDDYFAPGASRAQEIDERLRQAAAAEQTGTQEVGNQPPPTEKPKGRTRQQQKPKEEEPAPPNVDTTTGEVKQTPPPAEEPTTLVQPSAALNKVVELVNDMTPKGGDASPQLRDKVRGLVQETLPEGHPVRVKVEALLDSPDLGQKQVQMLSLRLQTVALANQQE